MAISLDFTDTLAMEKWITQAGKDIDTIGLIGTAYVLEALTKYKDYFETNISEESQSINYLSRLIEDTIVIFTQRLIDITLGRITFILK